MKTVISDVMTTIPARLEDTASLETGRRLIERYNVRHLPVMREGKLVGVLSDRDLQVALAVSGTSAVTTTVRMAMEEPAFQVDMNVPVETVAEAMARDKFGCAVIVKGDEVRGIFTTTDALFLLAKTLKERP